MDVADLRCLVAVVDTGTITAAASTLHVAQPAVSQRIRALERKLGVQLIHRSSRGVTTTTAGAALVERARDILGGIEAAEQLMTRYVPEVGRRVLLGTPLGIPAEALDALVTAYQTRFPQFDLRLVDMDTATQLDGLRNGTIDVGLVREPIDQELRSIRFLTEPLGVALRESDVLAQRPLIDLRELATRSIIVWPRRSAPAFFEEILSACRDAGFEPDTTTEAIDVVGALGRVAAGVGVHLLPEPAFGRYAQGLPRLRWRPLNGEPLAMRTSAAWVHQRAPAAASSALLDVIAAAAARNPLGLAAP